MFDVHTDVPSEPENLTATTDTTSGSVLLSWTPPINSSECVVSYIITSTLPNSTVSISTTPNHTLFAEGGAIPFCTYTASVAANDTAGRIGNWSHVLFSFSGSSSPMSGCFFSFPLLYRLLLCYYNNYYLLCTTCKDELMNIRQLTTSLR